MSPQFCRVNAEELAGRTDSSNVIAVLLALPGVGSCRVRVWHCRSVEALTQRRVFSNTHCAVINEAVQVVTFGLLALCQFQDVKSL